MANEQEPKDTFDEKYDAIMNPSSVVEQPGEQLTPTEQPVAVKEAVSDTVKTPSTEQQPETDKGFASHPAWQAREAKLKEAREALQAKEQEAQRYAKLLDDLQKRQQAPVADKQAQALSIAEQVCALKKWDINRLDANQRAVVEDQIELALGVYEIQSKQQKVELDQRLAPLEQAQQRWEQEQAMAKAESKWATLSKEDGLDDKIVQEAINKYCLEMDKTDPQRQLKLTDEDLYYRATRPLLREKEQSQVRQEARNTVKANARPLGKTPGTAIKAGPSVTKKSEDEYLDTLLDKHGVRN